MSPTGQERRNLLVADRRATASKWEDRRKAERATEPVSGRRTHTPGPWRATTQTVTAPETENRLSLDVRIYGGNRQDNAANARRIASCVNALDDLPQAALDGGWTRAGLEAYGLRMEQQRDELLAAAQLALDWLVSTGADGSPLHSLRDAIANAGGAA